MTTTWSLEAFCERQQEQFAFDETSLDERARLFLQALQLPMIHPFCSDPSLFENYVPDGDEAAVPPMGPMTCHEYHESWWQVVVTFVCMALPTLWAMCELWLRLFAAGLAPLGVAHLLYTYMTKKSPKKQQDNKPKLAAASSIVSSSSSGASMQGEDSSTDSNAPQIPAKQLPSSSPPSSSNSSFLLPLACVVSVASSVVLMTDTLYVLEFGAFYGMSWLLLSTWLSWNVCVTKWTRFGIISLLLLACALVCDPKHHALTFGDPKDAVNIEEGLYYDDTNDIISKVPKFFPESLRTYSNEAVASWVSWATPWMPTGDAKTGLPFLLNRTPRAPKFVRVWLPTHDGEVVALDIAFPTRKQQQPPTAPTPPVYLILHGLNGGSQEAFVRDFVHRNDDSVVVIMVARGLMDLPLRGWNAFHGARTADVHATAVALKRAMKQWDSDDIPLAGVGYSMGAIILNNYVARHGKECALDMAASISGGLDMRMEIGFGRAQRLWQPFLAETLRQTFLMEKWGERVRHKLSPKQLLPIMRATHVEEIDRRAVVPLNGFNSLEHYYAEMSALGDISSTQDYQDINSIPKNASIHQIAIPLCVIHALDDPLVTWRTVAANDGFMHPSNLAKSGTGNLVMLLTKSGGHVGWPIGWFPFLHKWQWMNNAAAGFVRAVQMAQRDGRP